MTDGYQTSFSCDSVDDNICYFITRTTRATNIQASRIDFSDLSTFTLSDPPGSDYYLSDVSAVNKDEAIVAGFSYVDYDHTFYKYNFNTDTIDWAVQAGSLCK